MHTEPFVQRLRQKEYNLFLGHILNTVFLVVPGTAAQGYQN